MNGVRKGRKIFRPYARCEAVGGKISTVSISFPRSCVGMHKQRSISCCCNIPRSTHMMWAAAHTAFLFLRVQEK